MRLRILYALGPGNVCDSFEYWERGEGMPSQTSLTFSGQFFDFCTQHNVHAWCVSSNASRRRIERGSLVVQNMPKVFGRVSGALYHIQQSLYALRLLACAIRFKANLVLVDSGTTHWFLLSLLRLAGKPVVAVLHNTLWPVGHRPSGAVKRLFNWLDGKFFRHVVFGALTVSPECTRQVTELANAEISCVQFRPQYVASDFLDIPHANHSQRPFRILFVGRCEVYKGVFDVLEIAQRMAANGEWVQFDICGDGSAAEELGRRIKAENLQNHVRHLGQLGKRELLKQYADCHVVIIPTRSDFVEGFAMVAAEAVLAGRPVTTSKLVPALEVVRGACLEARAEDTKHYASLLIDLLHDRELYEQLSFNCQSLALQFTSGMYGFDRALESLLRPLIGSEATQ